MKRSIALVLVAAAATPLAAPASGAVATPVSVRTTMTPRWLYFGDEATARIDVGFDPSRVDARSVQIQPSFGAWQEIAPRRSVASTNGAVAHRTWWFTLACISIDCVPRGTAVQRFRLPKATVTATTVDGTRVIVRRDWPQLRVAGRFAPAHTVGLRPVFQLDTNLPAATFRADPGTLALILDAIGGLLIAAAIGLGALELTRWWRGRRTRADTTTPLARALALAREAQDRDPSDRRRAASLLARTLPAETDGLRAAATEIAWSPAEPTPSELAALADAAERRIEERT